MRGNRTPTPPDGTQADASIREEIAELLGLAALREQQAPITFGQRPR